MSDCPLNCFFFFNQLIIQFTDGRMLNFYPIQFSYLELRYYNFIYSHSHPCHLVVGSPAKMTDRASPVRSELSSS